MAGLISAFHKPAANATGFYAKLTLLCHVTAMPSPARNA
jgi:hypothetical protein